MKQEFEILQLVEPLMEWYDEHARILPWREEPTPYRVWVSEIMLQQTRVEAVKPFFERFMAALPDIRTLAECPEDELLKLWEGLGYYNRVRNLQKAAQILVNEYDGRMPGDFDALMKLPGIGSYTAGAISSIAFSLKRPAVDGNVLRIISRVTMDDGDILSQTVKRSVENLMEGIMPLDRPGDFNQALMELGATVCIPNGMPKCVECPWKSMCLVKKEEAFGEYPKKKGKKARTIEEKTIIIIMDEENTVLQKRPSQGLLAGLYEFPTMEGFRNSKAVLAYVKELGFEPKKVQKLDSAKHIFSHKEWHMIGYAVRVSELTSKKREEENTAMIIANPRETEEKYPIPAAFLTYTDYLNIKLGNSKFK